MPSSLELRQRRPPRRAASRRRCDIPATCTTPASPSASHLALHVAAQRSVADQQRLHAGTRSRARAIGAHEVERILVTDELRDLDDERRAARDAERREHVARRRRRRCDRTSTPSGTTRMRPRAMPLASSTRGDGARDRDEHRRAPVLQSRADVVAQPEIDAARDDERHAGARPSPAPRRRRRAPCARARRRCARARSRGAAATPRADRARWPARSRTTSRPAGSRARSRSGSPARAATIDTWPRRASSRASHSAWRSPPRQPRSVSTCSTRRVTARNFRCRWPRTQGLVALREPDARHERRDRRARAHSHRRARQPRRSRLHLGAHAAAARAHFPMRRSTSGARPTRPPSPRLIPHVTNVIAADPFWAVPPHLPRPSIAPFLRSVAAVAPEQVRRRHPHRSAVAHGGGRRRDRAFRSASARAAAATRIFSRMSCPRRIRTSRSCSEQARLLSALGIRRVGPHYRARRRHVWRALARRHRGAACRHGSSALHPFARRRAIGACRSPSGRSSPFALHARGDSRALDRHARGARRASPVASRIRRASTSTNSATARCEPPRPRSRWPTLFVGHDSGPLHVAAAFGVPVVGVFAPGQPDRTFPQGAGPVAHASHADAGRHHAARFCARSTTWVYFPRA